MADAPCKGEHARSPRSAEPPAVSSLSCSCLFEGVCASQVRVPWPAGHWQWLRVPGSASRAVTSQGLPWSGAHAALSSRRAPQPEVLGFPRPPTSPHPSSVSELRARRSNSRHFQREVFPGVRPSTSPWGGRGGEGRGRNGHSGRQDSHMKRCAWRRGAGAGRCAQPRAGGAPRSLGLHLGLASKAGSPHTAPRRRPPDPGLRTAACCRARLGLSAGGQGGHHVGRRKPWLPSDHSQFNSRWR